MTSPSVASSPACTPTPPRTSSTWSRSTRSPPSCTPTASPACFAAAEFLQQIPLQRLILSPGDLDEVIIAFLAFGADEGASAFERTAAFRAGFVGGVGPCEDLLG